MSDAGSSAAFSITASKIPHNAELMMKTSGIALASAANTAASSAAVSAVVRTPPRPAYVRKARPSELPIADISAPTMASSHWPKASGSPTRLPTPSLTKAPQVLMTTSVNSPAMVFLAIWYSEFPSAAASNKSKMAPTVAPILPPVQIGPACV